MFVVRDIELYTNYEACINGFTTSFENSINKANALITKRVKILAYSILHKT